MSLEYIYSDISSKIGNQKSTLLTLLDDYLDFPRLISKSAYRALYKSTERNHEYHLESSICTIIIQRLYCFDKDLQLFVSFSLNHEVDKFCKFTKITDAPILTRFKQCIEANYVRHLSKTLFEFKNFKHIFGIVFDHLLYFFSCFFFKIVHLHLFIETLLICSVLPFYFPVMSPHHILYSTLHYITWPIMCTVAILYKIYFVYLYGMYIGLYCVQ